MNITFIGLGIMGRRMAARLLAHGHTVTVWNRTPDKCAPLVSEGAHTAATPAAAARGADLLITMLAHPRAVRDAATGADGFLHQLTSGSLWMDCSTCDPAFSRTMAREATGRGIHFLDAPVSGTAPHAENGELTFLIGGHAGDVERARPVLEVLGNAIHHVGDWSHGSAMKLVTNLLLASAMTALSEGLALGEGLGLSRETLLDTLLGSPVAAPFLAMKRGQVTGDRTDTHFPLRWMHKDMALVSGAAFDAGVTLPAAEAIKSLFGQVARDGFADADFAAISRWYQRQIDPAPEQ